MSEIYPGGDAQYSNNLGLALWGADEVVVENFLLIDAAIGSGSSVQINGTVIPHVNFVNSATVTFSVVGSNVSATAAAGSSAWANLTGDLTETQVIPWDGGTVGTADTGISRLGAASLAIGNGTTGNQLGSLYLSHVLLGLTGSPFSSSALEAHSDASTTSNTIESLYVHSSNANYWAPEIVFARSEGTQASPVAVGTTFNGDYLAYITFKGFDGTSYATGVQLWAQMGNTPWTTSDHSAILAVAACAAGAANPSEVWRFNSNSDDGGDYTCNSTSLPIGLGINCNLFWTTGVNGYQGVKDTSLSRISAGLIGVGTGAQGSLAGSLSMANITVSGTTSFAAASIAVAALSADTIGLTDSTGLFTVTGSPATLGGSLTLSAFASQSQNYVLAGPATGGAGAAAFRALVAADIPSAANLPLWSNLQNAAANLTLANAGYTTTFNQTSAVAWLWANTTVGTVGSTNASPLLEFAANYWATGGVTGVDLWTIGTAAIVAGLNGRSNLTFTHTGTTGQAAVQVPLLNIGGTDTGISRLAGGSLAIGNGTASDVTGALTLTTLNLAPTATPVSITNASGAPHISSNIQADLLDLYFGATKYMTFFDFDSMAGFAPSVSGHGALVVGNLSGTGAPTRAAITFGQQNGLTAQSGSTICVTMGDPNTYAFAFAPASGTSSFIGLNITPSISGTTSGATTVLVVNPTITTTNLTGTNLIASFQSAGTHKLDIDYSGNLIWSAASNPAGISYLGAASLAIGNGTAGDFSGTLKCATVNATSAYQANGTPGVTQTAIAVGTLATIEGIVTTFTGVSDERLKNHAPYTGGLEEILGITPIRFTYNELGQKFGGWDKEHVYVGFSAQNVQKSIPEAIQGTEGEEKYLSFDDRPVIAALCNAVKGLSAKNDALEARLAHLEKIIEKEGA